MFAVVRLPCLMEDEGRSQLYGTYNTLEKAEQAIEDATNNDTGYFRRSNFKILSDASA